MAMLQIDNVAVVKGDLAAGYEEHGPYDCIFVNGAVFFGEKASAGTVRSRGGLLIIHKIHNKHIISHKNT